jgi:hypothetical protein
LINPSQAEDEEMVETRLTPSPANTLKALLNQPFASTFDHSRTEGELLLPEALVVNMAMMALKIGLDLEKRAQGLTCKQVCVHQVGQVG